jgi:hypothetical protein
MDYYQGVVIEYLRSDRAVFVNTECCIQMDQGDNPDDGVHWYCDAVACDFGTKQVFLCEVSYGKQLSSLAKRLRGWNESWDLVRAALWRDSQVPVDWEIRPWLFVPETLLPTLLKRIEQIATVEIPLRFKPRITTLEMVQPWRYRSWNRVGEAEKTQIPEAMRA